MSVFTEEHFSGIPEIHRPRSRFNISHDRYFSFNVGDLVPFDCLEVLPGDTFEIDPETFVRLQTPVTDFIGDLYLDLAWFFVPNRLVWRHWKEFCGDSNPSAWQGSKEYTVPFLCYNGSGNFVPFGSVGDFLGAVPNFKSPLASTNTSVQASAGYGVSALPYRAFALIYNEWYRDENTQEPLLFTDDDSDHVFVSFDGKSNNEVIYGGALPKVNKYHDYFTSCLPRPQKGNPVEIQPSSPASVYPLSGTFGGADQVPFGLLAAGSKPGALTWNASNNTLGIDDPSGKLVTTTNLRLEGLNITINDLRLAFATQHWQETDGLYGSRYTELLRSHFGVDPSDASLQRPQYLGGCRTSLNVNQVVQTSGDTADSRLGDVAAFSATWNNGGGFTQSFSEHGYIIGCCCVRYHHAYQQGLSASTQRRTKFDYYWPEFANIGNTAVRNNELYLNPTSSDDNIKPFGYQEAWASYRMVPNSVSGEMRSSYPQSLDFWHLADDYTSKPVLSSSWMQEDTKTVDRVLAVKSELQNQLFGTFNIHGSATRCMPTYSVPGLDKL